VDLPAANAGKITKITVKVGDKVKEGDVIGTMEVSGDSDSSDTKSEAASEEAAESDQKTETRSDDSEDKPKPKPKKSGGSRTETVVVPKLDGFDGVPVIEINVSEGDTIQVDDGMVTVESDKATMEIPSPYAGKVTKIL